ncbi:hypothetical protein CVT24_000983 [Panaeolus cyanescens]|uniref:Peptidase C14 caspase domain-containing protein n=1 Tax=Panaeolus cyanescens TaxID=181874 RepID=A0A409YCG3_9AGAR|nr:hypothetical protein CVT24_000983 [Panaeolus cyanescens]
MHPALQNHFILHHIFDQWDIQETTTGCYNAALVCRTFYNPSQDVLWRRLNSVLPLFKLLSNFSYDETDDIWVMIGDVSPSELQTLQVFGRRVREMRIHVCKEQIDPSAYVILTRALGANPLLPNIQELTYSPWFNDHAFHIILNLLFSPSLRQVDLTAKKNTPLHNYSTFTQRLVMAPQLTHLHLWHLSPSNKVLDGIFSLKNLSDVALDLSGSPKAMINRAMLFSLGALECLSRLTIRLAADVDWVPSDSATTKQSIVFSKLVYLTLHCSFDDALQLVASSRLPSLQILDHQILLPEPPINSIFRWKEFINGLRTSTTSQFTSLYLHPSPFHNITNQEEWAIMETHPNMSFHDLADSLLQLNLTELRLCFPLFHSLCVDDFAAMGAAWPDMTSLQLHAISLQNPIPDTSLLRLITTTFPRLSFLSTDVNAERIEKPSRVSSSHPLKTLQNAYNLDSKPDDPLPKFYPTPKAIMVTPIYDDRDLGAPIPSEYTRSPSRPISGYYSDSDSASYRDRPYVRAVYTDSEYQDDRTERGSRYSSPPRSRTPSEGSSRGRRPYTPMSYQDDDRYNRYSYHYSRQEPYRDSSAPRYSTDLESHRYSAYPSRPSSYAPHASQPSPGAYYGRASQQYPPFIPPSHAGSAQAGPSHHHSAIPFVLSHASHASRPPASTGSWEHIYPSSASSTGGRSLADERGLDEVFEEILRLIPVNPRFCFSNCTGRKKAVCVGVNYTGQKDALKGCGNDARAMRKYLMEFHNFKSQNIMLLTDDELGGASAKPTRREMFDAMKWLVADAKMHDSLFFHYSGHGGQVDDETGQEADGKDEVIFPMDFKEAGDIVDDELFKTLVEPLPPGVRLTAVFDSCHSGTVLDLPYLHSAHGRLRSISHISRRMRKRGQAPSADVISFSACRDDETSADTFHGGVAVGAMSYALISTLKKSLSLNMTRRLKYQDLIL